MPITRQDVNDDITAKISGKTTAKSITPVEDGANRELMMNYLDQEKTSLPYKTYKAFLSCTDGINVVMTVMQNTIGAIVWTRNSAGNYKAELAGAFTLNKTIGFTSVNNGYYINSSLSLGFSTDILFLVTYVPQTNVPVDYIERLAVEIQVYN